MATTLFFHTSTRILTRVSTNPATVVAPDESSVVVPDGFDLGGGPWKLGPDNLSKVKPTQAEIDAFTTLPLDPELQAIMDAIDAIVADGTLPPKLKTFVSAFKARFGKNAKRVT